MLVYQTFTGAEYVPSTGTQHIDFNYVTRPLHVHFRGSFPHTHTYTRSTLCGLKKLRRKRYVF